MKVIWMAETEYTDATPAFRYTDDERAVLLGALEAALAASQNIIEPELRRMISTHKSIEAAIVAMRKAQ